MSLFGALSSGVSGLSAQSSAMGAVSDNIVNVSTIGYKNTTVNFQTLVTAQTSTTAYSAGGVQSRPRQNTGVQGLLQATNSRTDIGISGQGYFVVNELSRPTATEGAYLFTRAGSFYQDDEGFLRNTSGFYLQGWPVDAGGNVIPANENLTIPNQNVLSPDFLTTVNLSRVGGTATATSRVVVGANLPANAETGQERKTDIQIFDSLGNPTTISAVYRKLATDNQWDITMDPPSGTSVLTQYDNSTPQKVFDSIGQLEFGSNLPQAGSVINITDAKGTPVSYIFRTDGTAALTDTKSATTGSELFFGTIPTDGDTIEINGVVYEFESAGGVAAGNTAVTIGGDLGTTMTNFETQLNGQADYDATNLALRDTNGDGVNDTVFLGTRLSTGGFAHPQITSADPPTERVIVDISSSSLTSAGAVDNFITAVQTYDPTFDTTNQRIRESVNSATTVLFQDDGTGEIGIDASGLVDDNGNPVVKQTKGFTVEKQDIAYTDTDYFTFGNLPNDGETITLNGITYEFNSAGGVSGTNTAVTLVAGDLNATLDNLRDAIISADNLYNTSNIRLRDNDGDGNGDTLAIDTLANQSADVTIRFSAGFANMPTAPDGANEYVPDTPHVLQTKAAVVFNAKGNPTVFNTTQVEILGFANGAADIDGGTGNPDRITLDFGTIGDSNGLTQFAAPFTPGSIQQNGARFGVFSRVDIDKDGLVTAVFDNGETRPIYKLPVTTFTNVNELNSRTGNVWNATSASGDPTLREADNGPAGSITQASLEQSTVDIGTEFTNMIVIQRAYSAAAKVITTSDEMLEELVRIR